ncbi:hypothetical protein [Streptomyces sp. NPDC026673]|uniref:hypothetical protein n=1 Tax=Streptomyces sp. NPDC026673 TaxID=3155724 RepID=UPI0033C32907
MPGADTKAERELSAFLEHVVPQPPAPANRMANVMRRMQRRRRRRLGAMTVGTAAALSAILLSLGGSLLPGTAAPHRETDVMPATAPVGTPSETASLDGVPTQDAHGYTTIHLGDLYGLTLRLPRTWAGFTTLDPDAMMVGFLSPQPMQRHQPCGTANDSGYPACPPFPFLNKDSALIYVHKRMYTNVGGDAGFELSSPSPAASGCRVLAGTTEMRGEGGIPTARDRPLMLAVDICLRDPSQETIAAINQAFKTAEFRGGVR